MVFKVFEAFVTEVGGEDLWEDVLEAVTLETEGPFVGPGTYPDEDLMALVGEAVARLGLPLDEALVAFGRFAFPRFAASYPGVMDGHVGPRSFLCSLDSIIHLEVRKLYPEARPPKIVCADLGTGRLKVDYISERNLCPLLRGLVEGMAAAFGGEIEQQETRCVRDGYGFCSFEMTFQEAA